MDVACFIYRLSLAFMDIINLFISRRGLTYYTGFTMLQPLQYKVVKSTNDLKTNVDLKPSFGKTFVAHLFIIGSLRAEWAWST